jgi:hypothetical protein
MLWFRPVVTALHAWLLATKRDPWVQWLEGLATATPAAEASSQTSDGHQILGPSLAQLPTHWEVTTAKPRPTTKLNDGIRQMGKQHLQHAQEGTLAGRQGSC